MKRVFTYLFYATFIILFYKCQTEKQEISDTLIIATFNCEFLWDGIEPEEGNPLVEFSHKGDRELAREHIVKVAEVIKDINPDIINLVEVEGIEVLSFLVDTFLSDLGYNIGFVKGIDTYTGQDVALLSKYPIDDIFRYSEKGSSGDVEKSVSKNYIAHIKIKEMNLAIIGLHFLSRPLDRSRIDERQAQADAIRTIATQKYDEEYELVILGDFNDYDGDDCCIDVNNNMPVTNVLDKIKMLDSLDLNDDLDNISRFIPKEKRYTAHWDQDEESDVDAKELSSIDHILISSSLFENIDTAYIYHDYNPLEVSDHFPVVVEIKL